MPLGLAMCRIGSAPSRKEPPGARRVETRSPHGGTATEVAPASHDHKPGQVIGFASDSVTQPGAHAGPTGYATTGGHEQLGGRMIEVVGMHRLDDGQVVRDFGKIGQSVRKFGAGLPVLGKRGTVDRGLRHPVG